MRAQIVLVFILVAIVHVSTCEFQHSRCIGTNLEHECQLIDNAKQDSHSEAGDVVTVRFEARCGMHLNDSAVSLIVLDTNCANPTVQRMTISADSSGMMTTYARAEPAGMHVGAFQEFRICSGSYSVYILVIAASSSSQGRTYYLSNYCTQILQLY